MAHAVQEDDPGTPSRGKSKGFSMAKELSRLPAIVIGLLAWAFWASTGGCVFSVGSHLLSGYFPTKNDARKNAASSDSDSNGNEFSRQSSADSEPTSPTGLSYRSSNDMGGWFLRRHPTHTYRFILPVLPETSDTLTYDEDGRVSHLPLLTKETSDMWSEWIAFPEDHAYRFHYDAPSYDVFFQRLYRDGTLSEVIHDNAPVKHRPEKPVGRIRFRNAGSSPLVITMTVFESRGS